MALTLCVAVRCQVCKAWNRWSQTKYLWARHALLIQSRMVRWRFADRLP